MRIFGREITLFGGRRKGVQSLQSAESWPWTRIFGLSPHAFQDDIKVNQDTVTAYWAVFSCVTLIAADIAKLPAKVMQRDKATRVFSETLLRPVLRNPNAYQTRLEFFLCWVFCQLLYGNTYVLKERDEKGFIVRMHILDPSRVTVLVSDDGGVYYQLNVDRLSGVTAAITVPASEIIHDRMYTLHHPLVGVSPIYACGLPAMQGAAIVNNSAAFFGNSSRPSGVLTAPGKISAESAAALKAAWDENYSGKNAGKVAVLGENLKYEAMSVNPVDAQLIEQLKMTAEMVCACYHVPGYKIGVGQMPTVNNTAQLNQQYYDQCLQYLIEKMELRLEEGLEIPTRDGYEIWFDLSGLLRMDPQARYDANNKAIAGGWMSPNEARVGEDLAPVDGGDTPYLQQQNYSLAALAKRDANDPFAKPAPADPAPAPPPPDMTTLALGHLFQRAPETLIHV